MTKPDVVLARLLELRRLTERRALEEQLVRQADCHRAQREVDEAADAAAGCLAHARSHEQQQIRAFIGQTVSHGSIVRFQENLDSMLAEHQQMQSVEQEARTTLGNTVAALAEARAKLLMRQRATAKLDLIAKQLAVRALHRQAALAEAGHEEHAIRGPSRPDSDGGKT
jgi:microcompartment protein CcmL/EutN